MRIRALAGAMAALGLAVPAAASAATLHGTVRSGTVAIARAPVTLLAAGGAHRPATVLGRGRTDPRGRFTLSYRRPRAGALLYATSGPPGTNARRTVRLAALLGPTRGRVALTERSTVAAAIAEAQFVAGRRIRGRAPGPGNAAAMARNLVRPRTGRLSRVIQVAPNGRHTPTLATFGSLADMLAPCARHEARCARLFRLATVPGHRRPGGTLQAFANLARNPALHARRLFALSRSGPRPYTPTLTRAPGNWGLFLRFIGDGQSMSGPGNIAFDAHGDAWVANNYEYSRKRHEPACGSDAVLEFRPDGRYVAGSPWTGGGLSGVGYGITFDPAGTIWLGNFGFAAADCPTQPPHDSASRFAPTGRALSPQGGYTAGGLSWPQGTVSDQRGNIWFANCGESPVSGEHDSVTIYPGGDPRKAQTLIDPSLDKPFDVAFNHAGQAFVSATGSDNVGMYRPDGSPTAASPITGGGLSNPMGVATDSHGNAWVSDSRVIDLPCPGKTVAPNRSPGAVTLISARGKVMSPDTGFTGGGATVPWGMAIDGDDNVWVSNFAGQRVSRFCGVPAKGCPRGDTTGDPISPSGRLRLRRPDAQHRGGDRPLGQRVDHQQLEARADTGQPGRLPHGRHARRRTARAHAAHRAARGQPAVRPRTSSAASSGTSSCGAWPTPSSTTQSAWGSHSVR